MDLLDGALECASRGWLVIPLAKRTKIPLLKAWQRKATTDTEVIREWWRRYPGSNIGVRVGELSGFIDCESDSPKEEADYVRLWDGDPLPTACFASSEVLLPDGSVYIKKHFLLQYRASLPAVATVKFGALTVKIGGGDKGTQSVFPPSIHPTGGVYRWLSHPNDVPIAEIPDDVLARLCGVTAPLSEYSIKTREDWERIIGGVEEGERNTALASYCGWLLRQAGDIESADAIHNLLMTARAVNESNKPPLHPDEVRTIFASLHRRELERRLSGDMGYILREDPSKLVAESSGEKRKDKEPSETERDSPESETATATKVEEDEDTSKRLTFKLRIVEAEPPRYQLYAPQFWRAEHAGLKDDEDSSYITLSAEQLVSPSKIRVEALKQAQYPLPRAFDKAWTRPGGLYERVVFAAERVPAPPEEIRSSVVAERLLQLLAAAPPMSDTGRLEDLDGSPCRMPDGSIVFNFTTVVDLLSLGSDKIQRPDLIRVTKHLDLDRAGSGGKYKKLSSEGYIKLARLAYEGKKK